MPASTKKGLHLAKSVSELNQMAEKNIPKVSNARLFVKSAEKLYKTAQESELMGDEEKAYVQFMKFFNVIMAIKKTPDYKKNRDYYDGLIGTNTCSTAIGKAESLSSSLKNRYEEREAEEVSKKLDTLDETAEKTKAERAEAETKKTEEEEAKRELTKTEETKPETPGGITASDLYRLMLDKETRLLLMDVRPAEDFQESHINYKDCISVPSSCAQPGSTTLKMEKSLPETSRDLWNQRANVDHIILLDWNSSAPQPDTGTVLRSLKDALFKWDQTTIIKSEPLVLVGGYTEWLTCFPTLTTNSAVSRRPAPENNGSALPSLDAIDYDMDLDILKTPEEIAREKQLKRQQEIERLKAQRQQELIKQQQEEQREQELNAAKQASNSMPTVNRSLKPKPGSVGVANSLGLRPSMNNDTNSVTNNEQKGQVRNNVNVIRNRTDLAEMRRTLDEADGGDVKPKNTNIMKQAELDKVNKPPPPVPTVNRSLKPTPSGSSIEAAEIHSDGNSAVDPPPQYDDDVDPKELQELKETTLRRQDELQRFQSENKSLALEHKARLTKLQAEEEKIEHLREMKSREMKETADLMRMKKKVEEEIRQLEQERNTREDEERRRKEEIDKMKKEENEKTTRVQELERLRAERKKMEADRKTQEEEAAAAEKRVQKLREQEKKDAEDAARQQALAARAEEDRKAETRRKAEQARVEKEREDKEKAEREKTERERKEREQREAQKKQEDENRRWERDEAAALAAKKQAELAAQSKIPSQVVPGMPVGWEKRLDQSSGRYYYIDHTTKKTHWSLPSSNQPTGSPAHTYKARLKDENTAPSSGGGGGLKRSHSSPNIAKLVDEEGDLGQGPIPHIKPQPLVERVNKPSRQLTIQTEVSAAKVRNLQPTWGSVGRGLTGLRNLGNTCYINSTIQCLSNTTPLVQYLLTDVYREDINRVTSPHKGKVAEEFAILIKSLWTGQYRCVVPRDFKSLLGSKYKPFAGYEHEDSQELLQFLMTWLHEDLNTVTTNPKPKLPEQKNDGIQDAVAGKNVWEMHKKLNDSMIIDIFQGQYKSTTTCLNCRKASVVFEPFMFLTLAIPNPTRCSLRDCLLKFSEKEKVSDLHCTGCKRKGDASKSIVIWKLPPILLIILNRFYNQGMWREKITAYVDFPLDLNMNTYSCGPDSRQPYSLYGVSNHYGRMEGGHYTAYCRNPNTQRWHKFDDQEVYEMSKSEIKSSAAYTLYYSSMKLDTAFK